MYPDEDMNIIEHWTYVRGVWDVEMAAMLTQAATMKQ